MYPGSVCATPGDKSDAEFVEQLRASTQRYLRAIDDWEAEYSKYYRLVTPFQVSSDLAPFQQAFLSARRDLEKYLPRVRRMCMRHEIFDPWQIILRVELGANTPQSGQGAALGRNERNMVVQCLEQLEELSRVDIARTTEERAVKPRRRGLLRRIIDYFF
jgi:hypothetical protein